MVPIFGELIGELGADGFEGARFRPGVRPYAVGGPVDSESLEARLREVLFRRDGGGRRDQLEGAALLSGVERCRRDVSNGES